MQNYNPTPKDKDKDKRLGNKVARDGEVVHRKFMLMDGRSMDPATAEIVNEIAASGASESEIKRQVCARRLGDVAVADKSQIWVDACFKTLSTPLDELNRPAQSPAAAPTPEQERERAQQAVLDAAAGVRDASYQSYVDNIRGAPRPDWLEPSATLEDGQKQAADAYSEYCKRIADGWKR